jgi:hypothetical protein
MTWIQRSGGVIIQGEALDHGRFLLLEALTPLGQFPLQDIELGEIDGMELDLGEGSWQDVAKYIIVTPDHFPVMGEIDVAWMKRSLFL